jgi:P4 family phage/plasmid primase-like protien
MSDVKNQLLDFMRSHGVIPRDPGEIFPGEICRFSLVDDKPNKKSGWIKYHEDGIPNAIFKDWRQTFMDPIKWVGTKENDKPLSESERQELKQKHAEHQRLANEERARVYAETAAKCKELWSISRPASADHPYLVAKGLTQKYNIKQLRDNLVIPVYKDGEICSLQFISKDLQKKFKSGSTTKCGLHLIGQKPTEIAYICEGWATGASIHDATGKPVVVAFNAENLTPVAQYVRKKYPDLKLVICADDDRFSKGNAGIEAATKAASAVQGELRRPVFPSDYGKPTDFNDLALMCGLDEVKHQLENKRASWSDKEEVSKVPNVYESKENGFFDKVPKRNSKGEEVLNSQGQPVMVDVPNFTDLAKYLGNEHHLATAKSYSYTFEKDHYRQIDDLELKNTIDQLTLDKCIPSRIDEFLKAAIYKNFKPTSFFEQPDGFINLKNGILDIKSRKLLPRDPGVFFKYVLPHEFDESADCPNWLSFLDFVFEGNQELCDLSAEVFGYVLAGGTPWLHKAFFLDGSGRNGKSTWLDVLKHLIGRENYCSIPIRNLDKPFSVVMADGKLANIVGELEGRDLNSEVFKIAVGGEELVAAHKGKDEYQLAFTAKMVFATNNPPNFKDTSAGYYERLCVIPFRRYIKEEERDASIGRKLLTEIPGVLNWALNGLERLEKRGHLPSIQAVKDTISEYRESNDAVFDWVRHYVHFNTGIENKVTIGDYYEPFKAWCQSEGRYPISKNWFVRAVLRELKAQMPNLKESRPQNKVTVLGDISIKSSAGNHSSNGICASCLRPY